MSERLAELPPRDAKRLLAAAPALRTLAEQLAQA